MAYAALSTELHSASRRQTRPASPPHRGFWHTIVDAIYNAHQRQAQREIERLVAQRGGIFNDSLERAIAARLQGNDWH